MQAIFDALLSLLEFLRMLISFPLWLMRVIPDLILIVNDAINALPDFVAPVALLSVSLIVVMGVVKIL